MDEKHLHMDENEKITIKNFSCSRFQLVPNMSPRFKKSQKWKIKRGGLIWTSIVPPFPEPPLSFVDLPNTLNLIVLGDVEIGVEPIRQVYKIIKYQNKKKEVQIVPPSPFILRLLEFHGPPKCAKPHRFEEGLEVKSIVMEFCFCRGCPTIFFTQLFTLL